MELIERAIARAMERYLATISIPRALAALEGMWNFDPTYGGDPARFAAVHRWREALADGSAAASDPSLMLDAMCSLFAGAAMRVAVGPAPAGDRLLQQELRDAVASCLALARDLAELFDEANGTEIESTFLRRTDAIIASQSAGAEARRAEARRAEARRAEARRAEAGSRFH